MFSDFLSWWRDKYVEGWHLDKDLLVVGNKEYSPAACLYIPMHLNAFSSMSFNRGDDWPIGAFLHKRSGRFFSKVNDGCGGTINLGTFRTPIEAHQAWYEVKMEMAIKYKSLCNSIHPKLHAGLIRKIESLHHPDAKNVKEPTTHPGKGEA
ncbi:hypothetical protein AO825_08480 [Pectobacterium brasiliense]|nr:hypothetical protein AO825_08480 [Pectobacterium brasiliense]